MKLYPLGAVLPRFVSIASSTNTTPIVVTTATAHGLTLNDVITINGHLVNTNAVGTYVNNGPPLFTQQFTIPSPTTISLTGIAGNGVGINTGTASAPKQIITTTTFPNIPGVADTTKLLVAKMLFIPAPFGTAVLFVGTLGLNQAMFQNVLRPINPPPALGIYDSFEIGAGGENIIPIGDYWVDSAKPGTEGVMCSFWIR